MTAYAWFIMGQSFVTTALVFGVWFSYAVFFVAMLESFDWSRGGAAMAFRWAASCRLRRRRSSVR